MLLTVLLLIKTFMDDIFSDSIYIFLFIEPVVIITEFLHENTLKIRRFCKYCYFSNAHMQQPSHLSKLQILISIDIYKINIVWWCHLFIEL